MGLEGSARGASSVSTGVAACGACRAIGVTVAVASAAAMVIVV
jgi:hypothetical protein